MRTDADLTGILIQETDSSGYITLCVTNGNLDVTAGKFAKGCIMQDGTNGLQYVNDGTTAVPTWNNVDEIGENDEIDSSFIQVKELDLTAANIIAMYTTAIEVVPAVTGKAVIVDSVDFVLTGTVTQFTGGGVVGVQYKNTANGAGTLVHADIAASVVTSATGKIYTTRIPVVLSSVATADINGIGLFISNQTAVFATGTGTGKIIVRYHLVD